MSDVDPRLEQGLAHQRAGRLEEAKVIYQQILQANENDPNALNLLGMIHHVQGRQAQAGELISRAIEAAPAVAGFHNNLGNVRLAQRKNAAAEEAYRRAIKLEPKYVEAINNLGVSLIGQGKINDSIPLFVEAIRLRHDYPSARANLGGALRAKRMYREAAACYRDAIAFKPDHHEAWAGLAIAHLEMGQIPDAEAACRKAIELRPDALGPLYTLSLTLESAGRHEEALEQIRHAIRLRPEAKGLQFHLAAMTGEHTFATAPPEFVASLFDHYADTFDRHLLGTLQYRAPQLLHDAVAAAGVAGSLDIVDLGCGTGLSGMLFKPQAHTLVGVDLSTRMINQARERGVYDDVFVDELTSFLGVRFSQFDLAIASDVLNYFGDLTGVLRSAAQAVRSGGTLAFTLEKHEGSGYALNRTRRYTHSIEYVRSLLATTGWEEMSATEAPLRTEGKKDVSGWVIVLRKS
jgi:predicted TPR repeat methyltransferase